MRWPLRSQIMLPMILVMLGSLLGVSSLNAYLSARREKGHIEAQLKEVARTLKETTFPLTEAVLKQVRGLSGAEFVLTDESGYPSHSTIQLTALPANAPRQQPEELTLGESIEIASGRYFHVAVTLHRHHQNEPPLLLHILYPERTYREAWRHAVYPPLIIGGVAVLLVALLAAAIASRVAKPLRRLEGQVDCIAQGDFHSIQLPDRNDEIRDLSESFNRMAMLLGQYEEGVRQSERLKTLGQLGSGIAHQMRNSATGSRLAIELHQHQCEPAATCECLEVATRQLSLMEQQLQRFLQLGKPHAMPTSTVEMSRLIDGMVPLLLPFARHLEVAISWDPPSQRFPVRGDSVTMEQMVMNLLLNAVEAAARRDATLSEPSQQRLVTIRLRSHKPNSVALEIEDTGEGPPVSMQNNLFVPFATDKPDGTGLGLSVAKEIAECHGGDIRWQRKAKTTCFTIALPVTPEEALDVNTAHR